MAKRVVGWRRLAIGAPGINATPARADAASEASEADVRRIGFGAEVNGVLVVEQSLCIEGEFRGALQSANSIVVAETGSVEAPIRARTVEIHGAVVGDVVASREIVIFANGRLHGDVETPSLVVERGATFNGRTRMYRPERCVQASDPQAQHAVASVLENRR